MQAEVAETIGVDDQTVHNWETGKTTPHAHLRRRIIRFLGYDPQEHGMAFPTRGVLEEKRDV